MLFRSEIRKRQTVSVAVATSAQTLTSQMLDRGVLPDLLPSRASGSNPGDLEKFLTQGARKIGVPPPVEAEFIAWTVDSNFARWLPRLDACAEAILPPEDSRRRRWLRLAPRYLGRLAQRQHGVALTAAERTRFEAEAKQMLSSSQADNGQIVHLSVTAEIS